MSRQLNAPEQALLAEIRQGWGDAYSVVVEDGTWKAYPSYGPGREPVEAASGRELQRKLRRKTEPHRGPGARLRRRDEYGLNIGALIDDYPDFVICGDEHGYTARTRTGQGSGGATLTDRTLDGLAAQMDVCRRRVDGA